MPEHRARKYHQDRVAETLREQIGVMIEGELSDPRIEFCYVTEVVLNPGGKSARVYVAVDGFGPGNAAANSSVEAKAAGMKPVGSKSDERERLRQKVEANTVAGLEAAKGFIRFTLKERMGVRHVPELSFHADRSERFQTRIDELLGRVKKRHKAVPALGAASDAPTTAAPDAVAPTAKALE